MSTLKRTQRADAMANTLVLVRHGESEWNQKNIFTGIRNPDLTDRGVIEARWAGRVLRDRGLRFDIAFTSKLKRAQHTLDIILGELDQSSLEIIEDPALNERDYGELSGLNKEEARAQVGRGAGACWRRSFDIPPPGGESLKDTAARVLPYYEKNIWPRVKAGKNVHRVGARQFAARAHHESRAAFGTADPRSRAGDRGAASLPPDDSRAKSPNIWSSCAPWGATMAFEALGRGAEEDNQRDRDR